MTKKLSISIPYKQRIENLEIVFEALANQTINKTEFEVVIGAMEYSKDYISLCEKYLKKLNIISVLSDENFSIPKARNLAMRQATGDIIIQMDADTLLPPHALQNLYHRHFSFGQKICVVGQVVGYGNNNDGDVEIVKYQPYSEYRNAFKELENTKGYSRDPRFQVPHIIPWAFGWTGLIALPLAIIRQNDLYFDEEFQEWGVDDLEWSYRICKSKIPIVLCEDIFAIHLPHIRDSKANQKSERRNYQKFLKKWPTYDVELAYAFGDVKANSIYLEFKKELQQITDNYSYNLGIVQGNVDEKQVLIIGVKLDRSSQVIDRHVTEHFTNWTSVEVLPLTGLALPYSDKTFDECQIKPLISKFSDLYWTSIRNEAERVSKNTLSM